MAKFFNQITDFNKNVFEVENEIKQSSYLLCTEKSNKDVTVGEHYKVLRFLENDKAMILDNCNDEDIVEIKYFTGARIKEVLKMQKVEVMEKTRYETTKAFEYTKKGGI